MPKNINLAKPDECNRIMLKMRFYNKLLERLFELVKGSRLGPSLRGPKRDPFTRLLYIYIHIYIYIYIYI